MGLTRPTPLHEIVQTFGNEPFTTDMAARVGLTSRHLHELTASSRIRRLLKGVYVAANVLDQLELRVAAARLSAPAGSVVCDRHAAWLLGAEMVLAPGEHVETRPLVLLRRRGASALKNPLVVRGQRDLADSDITEVGGLAVTTPLRTTLDLGMVRWPSEALAGMNAMYRTGLVDKEEIVDRSSGFRGRRWVTTLRAVAPLVHGGCESPPEDIMWLRCREAHIELEPQVELWDGEEFIGRFDLADRELRFAVEYDGAEWHSSPEQLARDRRRRERARALGWVIVVLRAKDLFAQNLRAENMIRAGHLAARERAGSAAYAA